VTSALEELLVNAERLAGEAGNVVDHRDGRTFRYVDPSGAALTMHFDRSGAGACAHPGFDSEAQFLWRPGKLIADRAGCRYCDLVTAEMFGDDPEYLSGAVTPEMLYPLALTIETIGEVRKQIKYKRRALVTFSALLEEGEVWDNEEAFLGSQNDEVKMAPQSLIPMGLFHGSGEGVTSQVLAYGTVRSAQERRNELGGGEFLLIRVETLGGTFDVCAAPEDLEGSSPQPGAVLGGVFWLIGRPLFDQDDAAAADRPKAFSLRWRR